MRVALICETFLPNVNGVTTTICRMLEYLQARGDEVLLFAPEGAPSSYAGAEIVPLSGVTFPLYPELSLTPPQPGITAHLKRFKPDVVHAIGPVLVGATAPLVVQQLHLPLISSYHTDFGAYAAHYGLGSMRHVMNSWLRWIHNRTRMTLCPSTDTMRSLRRMGFRRLRVWGRGVDTARFHPAHRSEAWRTAVGTQPNEKLLLYVGRIAREKRVELIADALHGIDGVRLVMVGDGPARPEMEQRTQGLPVHFTGYLKGHDLATAYASADLFVFPSDTDTFGQVIQEAMASGLPVVGARTGGSLDLIQEGTTGTMFTPGASDDLHARLRVLMRRNDLRHAMGHAGRTAAERRSWANVMDELMAYYQLVRRRTPGVLLRP